MAAVDSQLSDQQARDRIGWAAGADATRDSTRIDSARRETIITDDLSVIVDHHDTGEILALVGARERPQPVIERGFAAFEALEIMRIGKWLDSRERNDDSGRGCVSTEAIERFRGSRSHRTVDGRDEAGIDVAGDGPPGPVEDLKLSGR